MRTAQTTPLRLTSRGPHGLFWPYRGVVQPDPSSLRPGLSFACRLRNSEGDDHSGGVITQARQHSRGTGQDQLGRDAAGLVLDVGAGQGTGTLVLVGFDPAHTTRVAGGENGGRTLTEVNVVRSMVPAGAWRGEVLSLHVAQPAGQRTALLLQADDGRLLAAAVLPPG